MSTTTTEDTCDARFDTDHRRRLDSNIHTEPWRPAVDLERQIPAAVPCACVK